MDDEWKDKWLNAQIEEIEKLSNNLRDIEIELIGVMSSIQELRASLESVSADHDVVTVQFTDMIRKNSDDILKHISICPHIEDWKGVWGKLTDIEKTLITIVHNFDVKTLETNHKQDLDIKELMVNARNSGMVAGGGIGTVCGAIVTIITNILMNKPG